MYLALSIDGGKASGTLQLDGEGCVGAAGIFSGEDPLPPVPVGVEVAAGAADADAILHVCPSCRQCCTLKI